MLGQSHLAPLDSRALCAVAARQHLLFPRALWRRCRRDVDAPDLFDCGVISLGLANYKAGGYLRMVL